MDALITFTPNMINNNAPNNSLDLTPHVTT